VSAPRTVTGPGRVNLIGDHTDYNQGVALPMAIGLGVTVTFDPDSGDHLRVTSEAFPGEQAVVDLAPEPATLSVLEPAWSRPIASLASLARPEQGGRIHIVATLPRGAGLASSAALCVALAELFGVEGSPEIVGRLCQVAEQRTGVPVGPMDPLVCAGAQRGHALWMDVATLGTRQVPVPVDAVFAIIDSEERRDLRGSPYAVRVAECEAAAAVVGPLGRASLGDLSGLRDPLLHRRARHVVTECARVGSFAEALAGSDLVGAGALMDESHRSLAEDFDVSTPQVDALVASLRDRSGVLGVRMTGAGFGGCVVALTRPGALDPATLGRPAWLVTPVDGTVAARVRSRPSG
jgi:galactokinase